MRSLQQTPQENPNNYSHHRDRSASGLRDLSAEFSGAGVGNVNALLNNPSRMDFQLQQDLYAKLDGDNARNAVSIEQR